MQRRPFITLFVAVAATWPLAAYAQQAARSYGIGYLALLPGEDATLAKAFSQRLQELGYSAGKNLTLYTVKSLAISVGIFDDGSVLMLRLN